MSKLSGYLAKMTLFALNSGARDNVICNLRWEWELPLDDYGFSIFVVPRQYVKGSDGKVSERIFVLNSVAQSVVESVRGQHDEFVLVYRRVDKKGRIYQNHPVETMNNTGWQKSREAAGLSDFHVHDLRHTFGLRLREAGVGAETRADLMWHTRKDMPSHYTEAQIVELHKAVQLVAKEQNGRNRTLSSLIKEAKEKRRSAVESPK